MELRHLRYFVAVAEELHFGRAAQRLDMAQPPLSRQIRALESDLGVRLLVRTKRRVRLTDAGRVFRDESRAALRRADQASEAARRAARGEAGAFAIAFAPDVELALIPRLIPPFLGRHAELRLEIQSLNPDQQIAALHGGAVQVGVAPLPLAAQGDIVVEPLVSQELCAVVPAKHRLANRPRLTLAAVAAEPVVFVPRLVAPRLHDLVLAIFREAGLVPRVRCHATHLQTCLALVAAGVGVTLLPAGTQGVCSVGVAFRRLRPPVAKLEIGIVYRRDEPSALRSDFITSAHAILGDPKTNALACSRPQNQNVVRLRARLT